MKIKIKLFDGQTLPKIIEKGDWIDLKANKNVELTAPQAGTLKYKDKGEQCIGFRDVNFSNELIPLGVAMKLPEGYEAHLLPRSGTYNKFGIIMGNMQGIIDSTYCGNNDEWLFNAIAFKHTSISKGDRICQFRITLSQKATIWQKIKWIFSSKIEFETVDNLDNTNRGGFNSTGIK